MVDERTFGVLSSLLLMCGAECEGLFEVVSQWRCCSFDCVCNIGFLNVVSRIKMVPQEGMEGSLDLVHS